MIYVFSILILNAEQINRNEMCTILLFNMKILVTTENTNLFRSLFEIVTFEQAWKTYFVHMVTVIYEVLQVECLKEKK